MGAAIAITSDRDQRQVGAKRLRVLTDAGRADEMTVRYLASLPARERDSAIEKLLTQPVSVGTLRRQRKVEQKKSQEVAYVSRSRDLVRDTDQLARLIDEATTDEVKLAALCRRLASRAPLQGNFVAAVRLAADVMDALAESELDDDAKAIVERNRVEMLARGEDPDAEADDEDDENLSTWQALAVCKKTAFSDVDGNAFGLQRKLKQD